MYPVQSLRPVGHDCFTGEVGEPQAARRRRAASRVSGFIVDPP
jgi:hypothetical protein